MKRLSEEIAFAKASRGVGNRGEVFELDRTGREVIFAFCEAVVEGCGKVCERGG